MLKYFYTLIISLCLAPQLYAQDEELNIQTYTPSVLLKTKQLEYKFFNNLYTQNRFFDNSGKSVDAGGRASYFASINQFLYGVSPKVNLGFDLWLKSVGVGNSSESPFGVLSFGSDSSSRTALSGFGPKIKLAPIRNWERFSVQSTILLPLAKDMEGANNGNPFLSADSYVWITEFFLDKSIGSDFQVFSRVSAWYTIDKEFDKDGSTYLATPASVFFSWFTNSRLTLYVQSELWPTYGNDKFISSYFYQAGAGVKYQLVPGFLEIEGLYTNFVAGQNTGNGETFNFGIRIIN